MNIDSRSSSFGILFAIGIGLADVAGFAAENPSQDRQMFVFGRTDDLRPGEPPKFMNFYVRKSQLPSTVAWSGESEFPLSLNKEILSAQTHLKSQELITNKLDLYEMEIFRLAIRPSFWDRENSHEAPPNDRWLQVFLFNVQPSGKSKTAVSLAGGAFATQSDTLRVMEPKLAKQNISSPVVEPEKYQLPRDSKDPYVEIRSRDLRLPEIQWNADSEPFPMDLGIQASRAKKVVAEKYHVSESKLGLQRIEISRFVPFEAVQAQGLDLGKNLQHWWVAFGFVNSDDDDVDIIIREHMLLDGRIL